MIYYYTLLTIFGFLVCIIIIDPNVGAYIDLQIKNIFVQMKRWWYLVTLYPVVQYNNWKIMREVNKIRKERGLSNED